MLCEADPSSAPDSGQESRWERDEAGAGRPPEGLFTRLRIPGEPGSGQRRLRNQRLQPQVEPRGLSAAHGASGPGCSGPWAASAAPDEGGSGSLPRGRERPLLGHVLAPRHHADPEYRPGLWARQFRRKQARGERGGPGSSLVTTVPPRRPPGCGHGREREAAAFGGSCPRLPPTKGSSEEQPR